MATIVPTEDDMVAYTILLLTEIGAAHELLEIEFEGDDAAIDHAGGLPHAYAIIVRQGDRDVARFPPIGATLGPFSGRPGDSRS